MLADSSEKRRSPQFQSLSPTHQTSKLRGKTPFPKNKILQKRKVEAILKQGLPPHSPSPEEEDKGDDLSTANLTNQFPPTVEIGKSPELSEQAKSVPPNFKPGKAALGGGSQLHTKSALPHESSHPEHVTGASKQFNAQDHSIESSLGSTMTPMGTVARRTLGGVH